MDDKTQVTLSGPAKIDGTWHKAGDTPTVDATTLQQLQDLGMIVAGRLDASLIALVPGAEQFFSQEDFDAAVEAKAKELAGAAFDGALKHLEDEVEALVAHAETLGTERAAALDRAEKAEKAHADYVVQVQADVDRLHSRAAELEATIAKLTPPAEPKTEKKPKGG